MTFNFPDRQDNSFYDQKFEEVKKTAQNISKDKNLKSFADKIINLCDEAINSENITSADLIIDNQYKTIINNAYEIEKNISFIDKNSSNKNNINNINYAVNDIIQGRELKNPSNIIEDEITGFPPDELTGLTRENIMKVINGKMSINELKTLIGLEAWSLNIFNQEPDNLLYSAMEEIEKNKNALPSKIIAEKLGSENVSEAASYLNSEFELNGTPYEISALDYEQFLNGDYKILFSVGNIIIDESLSMHAGATADFLSNNTNWQDQQGKSGLDKIWEMLGLGNFTGSYDGNILQKLSQNFLEQNLGLENNSFYGSIDDVVKRNGIERTLYAFGFNIPSSISDLQFTNPAIYDQKLQEFYGQIKSLSPNAWNFQSEDLIRQAMQTVGLGNINIDQIKNIFSGQSDFSNILNTVTNTIGSNYFTNDYMQNFFQLSIRTF